jgi:hypothetical protein
VICASRGVYSPAIERNTVLCHCPTANRAVIDPLGTVNSTSSGIGADRRSSTCSAA